MTTTQRIGLGALVFAAAIGCGAQSEGGQTGEERGSCWDEETPLEPSAVSPLGFSAEDSLRLVEGTHTATLHWLSTSRYPYGPETGDGRVEVSLKSLGTAVYATQKASTMPTTLLCAPALLSDVSVTIRSDAGALDESFNGFIAATNAESAELSATLMHLSGRFAIDPAALGKQRTAQFDFSASFSASDFAGSFSVVIEQSQGSGSSGTTSGLPLSVACWGRASVATTGCRD